MNYLRNIISKYIIRLDKVLPMLEDLKNEFLLDETPDRNMLQS